MIKNYIFYWPDKKVIYIPIHKNGSSFTDVFIEKLNYLNVDLNHIVLEVDLPINHRTFEKIGGVEDKHIISTKRNPYERLFSEFRYHGIRNMVKNLQHEGQFLDVEHADDDEKYNFFYKGGEIIDDSFISDELYLELLDKFIAMRCYATLWCPSDPHSLPQCFRWGSDKTNIIPNELLPVEDFRESLYQLYKALFYTADMCNTWDLEMRQEEYYEIYDDVIRENGKVNQTKKRFDTSSLLSKLKNKDLINFTYHWDFHHGGYKKL
tara:strand:+ start:466 stop:1260 length:795 start_codon:yes stop_codon:yes gene_type:complete